MKEAKLKNGCTKKKVIEMPIDLRRRLSDANSGVSAALLP